MDNQTQEFYVKQREYEFYGQKVPFNLENKQVKDSIDIKSQPIKQMQEFLKNNKNIKVCDDIIKTKVINKIVDNEKVIRYYQTKDRVLFLILQNRMQKSNMIQDSKSIKISEINPKFLERQISYKIDVNAIEEKYNSIKKNIIIDKIKIKNITTLKKLIHDKRLRGIFSYFSDDNIDYQSIRAEINNYNDVQHNALQKVFEFEERLIDKYRVEIENIKKLCNKLHENIEHKHIEHKPYLDFLKDKNYITQCEYDFLLIVRNKFCHNQFIDRDDGFYNTLHKNVIAKNISEQIFEKYANLVNDITKNRIK